MVTMRELHAPCAHRAKFLYIHCHRQCFSPIAAQIYHVFVLGHRQKETPDITQRPLVTIHKHLGTPARVVCCGPLHWVKSPETPEKARAVRAPCNNTPYSTNVQTCKRNVDACEVVGLVTNLAKSTFLIKGSGSDTPQNLLQSFPNR